MSSSLEIPVDVESEPISTSFGSKAGETIIVGTSNLPGTPAPTKRRWS